MPTFATEPQSDDGVFRRPQSIPVRAHVPTPVPTFSISDVDVDRQSVLRFYTPRPTATQDVSLVKPLPEAFKTTGVLAKKARRAGQSIVSVHVTPSTPSKRPSAFWPVLSDTQHNNQPETPIKPTSSLMSSSPNHPHPTGFGPLAVLSDHPPLASVVEHEQIAIGSDVSSDSAACIDDDEPSFDAGHLQPGIPLASPSVRRTRLFARPTVADMMEVDAASSQEQHDQLLSHLESEGSWTTSLIMDDEEHHAMLSQSMEKPALSGWWQRSALHMLDPEYFRQLHASFVDPGMFYCACVGVC
jgi:hypothetical protein